MCTVNIITIIIINIIINAVHNVFNQTYKYTYKTEPDSQLGVVVMRKGSVFRFYFILVYCSLAIL